MIWSLQDAKNRFSEVVDRAQREGPQRVTRRGKDAVVVVSAEEWGSLSGRTLAEFFESSPLAGSNLEIERDRSPVRAVEL